MMLTSKYYVDYVYIISHYKSDLKLPSSLDAKLNMHIKEKQDLDEHKKFLAIHKKLL